MEEKRLFAVLGLLIALGMPTIGYLYKIDKSLTIVSETLTYQKAEVVRNRTDIDKLEVAQDEIKLKQVRMDGNIAVIQHWMDNEESN